MQFSAIPTKFQIPFASSAGSGYIRTIPQSSQIGITNGAASLTDGFPPLTFLPVGSGGVPPFGQDFNGILNEITQWIQWQNAGGLVTYDSVFSTAIGGYPKNALLSGTALGVIWLNTVDNNTANPDSAGAGWLNVPTARDLLTEKFTYYVAGGTANALTITTVPTITSYTAGLSLSVKIATTNTSASTINVDGVGLVAITRADLSPTQGGDLPTNAVVDMTYDGTQFQINGLVTANLPAANTVAFTSSTTWTPPAGVKVIKRARVWGAGGAGGGANASTSAAGSGAGGGQYAESINLAVTPGSPITVTIGAGGASSTGANGTAGGSSSLGSLISAVGGGGGIAGIGAIATTSGAGGSGTSGNVVNFSGQTGGTGISITGGSLSGIGGGSFGSASSGPNAQSSGAAGQFPGGGGAGGSGSASAQPGGAGAGGLIVIEY
jgi:hypothetical protein